MLVGPAEIADRTEIDEADFEFLGRGSAKQACGGDKQNKNENDERQQALQNAKLYTRLPARESFRSISRKFWTAQASRGHVTFTAGVRLIWRRPRNERRESC